MERYKYSDGKLFVYKDWLDRRDYTLSLLGLIDSEGNQLQIAFTKTKPRTKLQTGEENTKWFVFLIPETKDLTHYEHYELLGWLPYKKGYIILKANKLED